MGGLLKQIAPAVTRAAVLRDPAITAGIGQFAVIPAVAPSVGLEVTPIDVRDTAEIEREVSDFARIPNGGLIVTASAATAFHRDLIVNLAARHKLPAVYYRRLHVAAGGLISYGADPINQLGLAVGYVDRILKGEKQLTFRCKCQPSMSSLSISRPPRHSASTCRKRCSPAPTRLSNNDGGFRSAK